MMCLLPFRGRVAFKSALNGEKNVRVRTMAGWKLEKSQTHISR